MSYDDIFPWYSHLFYILKSSGWGGFLSSILGAKILLSYLFSLAWDFHFFEARYSFCWEEKHVPSPSGETDRVCILMQLQQNFPEASIEGVWF